MAIDATKCINCMACVVACQQRNQVPYGQSRNWVKKVYNPEVPAGVSFQPGACMHCDKAVCVDACPTRATYKADDGSVVIDPARCISCGSCVASCPYNARFLHPKTGRADKCDYCRAHAVPGGEPACVSICPTKCRVFGDADNPADPVAFALKGRPNVHVIAKDYDTKPTLTYLDATLPLDWPQKADTPAPINLMPIMATGARWFGGLALFGVIGVFLKQLVLPSDREHSHHEDDGGRAKKERVKESAGPKHNGE